MKFPDATTMPLLCDGADRSRRRWTAVISSGMAAAASKVIALVCLLAQVPIALNHLGVEGFGLWMALTGAAALMSFSDLGLGLGIQAETAEAHGRDELGEVWSICINGMLALAAPAICLLLLAVFAGGSVEWASVFKITDPALAANTSSAVQAVTVLFCLGLPFTAFPRLALGLQRGWLLGVWSAAGAVASLAFVYLAALYDLNIVLFVIVAFLPPMIANIAMGVTLAVQLGRPRRDTVRVDVRRACVIIRRGAALFIPQLNTLVLFSAPPVLISTTLGAAAVTPYNLTQRLLAIVLQGVTMFISPMWAAFAEAKTRGDFDWIRSAFVRALAGATAVSCVLCLLFVVAAPRVIPLWAGNPSAIPSTALVILMSAFTFLAAAGQPVFCVLGACNRVRPMSIYCTLTTVLFLGIAPFAMRRFGVEGLVAALLAAYLIFSLMAGLVDVRGMLKRLSANPRGGHTA